MFFMVIKCFIGKQANIIFIKKGKNLNAVKLFYVVFEISMKLKLDFFFELSKIIYERAAVMHGITLYTLFINKSTGHLSNDPVTTSTAIITNTKLYNDL